jgi:antirestriction protein ArdC
LTFKQAQQLGGNVRKGEHGELVVYADRIIRTETDAKGEEVERSIPFMKGYTVFNVEQCEGLPAQYTGKAEAPALPLPQRIEAADRFFAATAADIRHGGTRAYYAEGPDYVQMPPFETFKDAESHAATLAHEPYPLDEAHEASCPRSWSCAVWRRRLCTRGACCRVGRGFPLRRSRHHARGSARSCRLSRRG